MFVRDAFLDAVEFQETGRYKGKEMSEDEFLSERFTEQATTYVRSINAPQVQPSEITTQEEFDALPSGAVYLEDGQQYRKP